ncbi:MAG: peptide chain release factor N(5)-glutamine methyltransferase [Clostridiales bacterium]|nr:peptide chain release factor N(5)-glutamine methyltransferase [Clostridiales bacterium]
MKPENKVKNVKLREQQALVPLYGDREAGWIVRALIEDVMGWSTTDIILNGEYELNDYTVERLDKMTSRVTAGEPVQYVTGIAPFYGMQFKVNPAVLIPRPETAELVDLIVKDYGTCSDLSVLDCGTGSGCIAIALARNLPFAQVVAIDKSTAALEVARDNASRLKVKVDFREFDILSLPALTDESRYDIIVSNPPYIARHEEESMSSTVKDYEPSMALFVPDDDPLRFYHPILEYATYALKPGGKLYFEINPLYVEPLMNMLSSFDDTESLRDSQGNTRFVTARRPTAAKR